MFCSKCGTSLPDNATFCSVCGAPQSAPAAPAANPYAAPAANPYAAPAANPYAAPAANPYAAPRPAGALKFRTPNFKDQKILFYIISAGLLLLGFIFSLTKVISATVSAFGYSESAGATLGECECGFFAIMVALLALAGIAACVMLALFNMPENIRKVCYIGAPSCAAGAFLMLLIGVLVGKGKTMGELGDYSSYLGDMVSIHMSFIGWLAVIFFLAAAGLTGYAMYNELKKPAAPTTYTPPYNPYG